MNPQEQTLWDRIIQVADNMRDLPDWKRGSSSNERDEGFTTRLDQQNLMALSPSSLGSPTLR
jgi:hypothetical protein